MNMKLNRKNNLFMIIDIDLKLWVDFKDYIYVFSSFVG